MNRDHFSGEPSGVATESNEPDDASDLDYMDMPCTRDDVDDESKWEVFVGDDDERDPEGNAGDSWTEYVSPANETKELGDR